MRKYYVFKRTYHFCPLILSFPSFQATVIGVFKQGSETEFLQNSLSNSGELYQIWKSYRKHSYS